VLVVSLFFPAHGFIILFFPETVCWAAFCWRHLSSKAIGFQFYFLFSLKNLTKCFYKYFLFILIIISKCLPMTLNVPSRIIIFLPHNKTHLSSWNSLANACSKTTRSEPLPHFITITRILSQPHTIGFCLDGTFSSACKLHLSDI